MMYDCISFVVVRDDSMTIRYRGQPLLCMSNQYTTTAAGDRVVLAKDDGQFTIIDFDESRINEI
jgi:hypothetical protein